MRTVFVHTQLFCSCVLLANSREIFLTHSSDVEPERKIVCKHFLKAQLSQSCGEFLKSVQTFLHFGSFKELMVKKKTFVDLVLR